MRYRYTVEPTVMELIFSATEAEHLRAALREAAEEYATGEVKFCARTAGASKRMTRAFAPRC